MQKTKTASNAELVAVLKILSSIVSDGKKEWPVSVGFRIIQNIEILQRETEAYRRERENIIYRFSSDGKVGPQTEGYEECVGLLKELDAIESTVTVQLISRSELEQMSVPLGQLIGLRFITAEKEDE